MNTLEFLGLVALAALTVIADTIRHRTPISRLHGLRALRLMYFCALLVVSGWLFVYLATHMAAIQPLQAALPLWTVWLIYGLTAIYILIILIRLGEVVSSILRSRSASRSAQP